MQTLKLRTERGYVLFCFLEDGSVELSGIERACSLCFDLNNERRN